MTKGYTITIANCRTGEVIHRPMTPEEEAAQDEIYAQAAARESKEAEAKALAARWPDPFALMDEIIEAVSTGGVEAVRALKAERDQLKAGGLDKKGG